VLKIDNFRICERELIQVLSALPALEHLELMNVDYGDYRVDLTDFLITDNILRALTFPARQIVGSMGGSGRVGPDPLTNAVANRLAVAAQFVLISAAR
jgi:hypothetical protein